jgi:hypothetical protein
MRRLVSLSLAVSFLVLAGLLGQPLEQTGGSTSWVGITGRVLLADGSPPAGPVEVELMCDRRTSRRVAAGTNGLFHFEFTVGSREVTDAELSRASTGQQTFPNDLEPIGISLDGCHIRVAGTLKGQAVPIDLTLGQRSHLDVGDIVIDHQPSMLGATISVRALMVPKEARECLEKALKRLEMEKVNYLQVAEKLQEAVAIHAEFALAWQLLGETRLKLRDRRGARTAFEQALLADPDYVKPYLSLARLDLYEEKWDEAVRRTDSVIAMNAAFPQAFYYNGVGNYYTGRMVEAERSLARLKEMDYFRFYPVAPFLLGNIHARLGRHALAAEEWLLYLELMPPDQMPAGQKQWLKRQLSSKDQR